MHYKKSSWKEKIDPAFDSFIKTIVKAFDLMESPSDSEIANLLEKTKKSNINSFKSFYENKNEKILIAAAAGAPLQTIKAALGHTDIRTTLKYAMNDLASQMIVFEKANKGKVANLLTQE